MFGLSWITELSSTSIRGIVYVTRPRTDVSHGDSVWQYGLSRNASGTASRIAQKSFSTFPVLVPPENVTPFAARRLNVTSTPLKTRVSSPTLLVGLISLFTCPSTFEFRL